MPIDEILSKAPFKIEIGFHLDGDAVLEALGADALAGEPGLASDSDTPWPMTP